MNISEVAELNERLDRIYDNAVFIDGMETEELNGLIREIYNSDKNAGVPYPVTRAKMLDFFLRNVRIAINDIGMFAGVVERPSLAGRYANSEIKKIQSERQWETASTEFPEKYQKNAEGRKNALYIAQMDLSHTSPDWDRILALGIPGLLKLAEEKYAETPSVFNESVKLAYTAFLDFLLRFSRLAEANGRKDLAAVLSALAEHAPATLREALQLSILYYHVQEIEGEWVRSMGVFDRQYLPFLEKDIASGILTEESAEELLIHYLSFFHAESAGRDVGAPMTFGGLLPGKDSVDGCNRLTRIAWSAFRKLGNPTPKFSLRWNPGTPSELMEFAAECIREGKNSMVFCNEPVIDKAFLKQGKSPEDLPNFVPIGCYEPAIMGKELSCTMSCVYNLAKPAEIIFNDNSFQPETYEDVEKRYFEIIDSTMREALDVTGEYEKRWNKINPSPILSGTMKECMEQGLDVSEYGTKYATSGVVCMGLATAVDILMAIETLVFERKMTSFHELGEILAGNWDKHEEMRQFALKRAPKWGCGNEEADRLGKKICRMAADLINNTPNAKGWKYQMGLWSIYYSLTLGDKMGATADGRLAGSAISKNTGSTSGCDTEGIAGLFESLSKLDHTDFADGAVFDVMLAPRTVSGPEGNDFIVNLIRTFFAQGGMFIQFNILSPEQLKEAQANPEKYRNLQVRLCGWNVRFVDLSKDRQDWVIREAGGEA